jgi:hypothetical protein
MNVTEEASSDVIAATRDGANKYPTASLTSILARSSLHTIASFLSLPEVLAMRSVCVEWNASLHEQLSPDICALLLTRYLIQNKMYVVPPVPLLGNEEVPDEEGIHRYWPQAHDIRSETFYRCSTSKPSVESAKASEENENSTPDLRNLFILGASAVATSTLEAAGATKPEAEDSKPPAKRMKLRSDTAPVLRMGNDQNHGLKSSSIPMQVQPRRFGCSTSTGSPLSTLIKILRVLQCLPWEMAVVRNRKYLDHCLPVRIADRDVIPSGTPFSNKPSEKGAWR